MSETTSTALVAFLRARLAYDERVTYNPAFMPVTGPGLSDLVKRAWHEIEAKRQIIDGPNSGSGPDHHDEWEATLRLLALPYATHPDYRDEWRP